MEFLSNLSPLVLALVPVIIGIVEVFKKLGVSTKYAPLLAILLGVLGVIGIEGVSVISIIAGIVIGLSSSGLFSGVKKTLE